VFGFFDHTGDIGIDIDSPDLGSLFADAALTRGEIAPRMGDIVGEPFTRVPTGTGKGRTDLALTEKDFDAVLRDGAAWAV